MLTSDTHYSELSHVCLVQILYNSSLPYATITDKLHTQVMLATKTIIKFFYVFYFATKFSFHFLKKILNRDFSKLYLMLSVSKLFYEILQTLIKMS